MTLDEFDCLLSDYNREAELVFVDDENSKELTLAQLTVVSGVDEGGNRTTEKVTFYFA